MQVPYGFDQDLVSDARPWCDRHQLQHKARRMLEEPGKHPLYMHLVFFEAIMNL